MTKDEINAELGNRFFWIRHNRGITQVEMARAIRKTRTSVTNLECGRQMFTLWTIVQMCEVLGVEPWMVMHPRWAEVCDIDMKGGTFVERRVRGANDANSSH